MCFTKKVLDDYTSTLPLVAIDEAEANEVADLGKEKLQAEIERIRENTKSIAFDRLVKEGKYILRTELELELASRAVAFGVGLKSLIEIKAGEIIITVNGESNKTAEFVRFFENILDEALNEFSKPLTFELDYSEINELTQENKSHDEDA